MHHAAVRSAGFLVVVLLAPFAWAQETGHGDLFGDLVHIKRSPITGQPILQKRWIEYPGDAFDWGYCPIPVDAAGAEIPFVDLSCDVDPTQLARLVEVDYFGRLSGGRTKEANLRMHLDEAIANIHEADLIELEAAGRIRMGTDCTPAGVCASWKVIDSPMENMALYHRLMKYGHLQTNPLEEDTSFHGDPELGTVYHPALAAEDWTKFRGPLAALLPRAAPEECFPGGVFVAACAQPQGLTGGDFVRAASFLAGAADKHGKMTVDLVQYLNRILRITIATPGSAATVNTIPALIRTCAPDVVLCTDANGVITPAEAGLAAPADERFVDFAPGSYMRDEHFNVTVPGLRLASVGTWVEDAALPLLNFLVFINGPATPAISIDAFVKNASDALRAVEFVHNYELPVDLYAAATTTTVVPLAVPFSASDRAVTLTAHIAAGTPVNGGLVIFVVETADGTEVGLTVASGPVVSGAASATYVVPAATPEQVLTVRASYSGAAGFAPSSGTGTLTITPPGPPQLLAANASVVEGTGAGASLSFELTLSWPTSSTVTVQYATADYTAVAPADYAATSGTATFNPGVTSVVVTVPVVGDSEDEPDETLSLVLSAVINATLPRSIATGRIVDDDASTTQPLLDFNQDGWADLLWRNSANGRIGVWYMQGLTQTLTLLTNPSEVTDLDMEIRAVGDFNGDWRPDVIWQHRLTGELSAWFFDEHVRTATSALAPLSGVSAEPVLEWKIVGAADMDRNGQNDLIWQHETTGELRIWHMSGTAQIDSTPLNFGVGASDWHVVGVADMNGDGWNDLVWRNTTLGGIATWLMEDALVLSTVWLSPAVVSDTSWRLVGVRDMNADGHADLVWQHDGDGRLAAWLMNRLVMSSTPNLTPGTVADLNWRIVGVR